MKGTELIGQLFYKKGENPVKLENRVFLPTGSVYLDAEPDFGLPELEAAGWYGPVTRPAFDASTSRMEWNAVTEAYEVFELSAGEKEDLWARKRADVAAQVHELRTAAENRRATLIASGLNTAGIDAFLLSLIEAEAETANPYHVVLPPPGYLYKNPNQRLYNQAASAWAQAAYKSDTDKGYTSDDSGIKVNNPELFAEYLDAHKAEIEVYALGSAYTGLAYITEFVDNLNGTGTLKVVTVGEATGCLVQVDGSKIEIAPGEQEVDISGSGSHEILVEAVGDQVSPETKYTFTIQGR